MGLLLKREELGHLSSLGSFCHFMLPFHLGDQVIKTLYIWVYRVMESKGSVSNVSSAFWVPLRKLLALPNLSFVIYKMGWKYSEKVYEMAYKQRYSAFQAGCARYCICCWWLNLYWTVWPLAFVTRSFPFQFLSNTASILLTIISGRVG